MNLVRFCYPGSFAIAVLHSRGSPFAPERYEHVYDFQQLIRIDRLGEIRVTPAAVTLFNIPWFASAGYHHDGYAFQALLLAHFLASSETIHLGHDHIEKY